MKRLVVAVVATAVLVLAGAADARAGISFGTTPAPISGSTAGNDVIGAREGWYGANLYLIAGATTSITVDFIGKEAGWVDTFYLNGGLLVTNTDTPGFVGTFPVNPGLITFSFGTPIGTVTNGSNTDPALPGPNYFVSLGSPLDYTSFLGDNVFDHVTPSFGTSVIIALNDDGRQVDDNHDDLVVRLTITNGSFQVPDGGTTLMLLGSALVGLGALRRKFRV